ncbi:MAG TPA: hypothetical protein VG674_04100 [Amycolatopsis sp.]|nr:hypothetical protein [Amycolatopsis sp.]
MAALQRERDELDRRQRSLLRQASQGDPYDPVTHGLRSTYNELEAQKTAVAARLGDLDAEFRDPPKGPGRDEAVLLETLPTLALNLAAAPPDLLRTLLDVLRLEV